MLPYGGETHIYLCWTKLTAPFFLKKDSTVKSLSHAHMSSLIGAPLCGRHLSESSEVFRRTSFSRHAHLLKRIRLRAEFLSAEAHVACRPAVAEIIFVQ